MVDEEVPLRHILRDFQPVDKARDQLGISGRLTKVLQFGTNSIEIMQVASQSIARLNGAVQLHLQPLSMIDRIILECVREGLERLGAGMLLVTADATSDDVLSVEVLDEGCQQVS